MEIRSPWRPVLEHVLAHPNVRLHEVAEATGLNAPTALRHLKALEENGLVEKRGRHKAARYHPCHVVSTVWQAETRHGWVHLTWQQMDAVDWEYPLLQRIRDEPARRTVRGFFERLHDEDVFHPWRFWERRLSSGHLDDLEKNVPSPLRDRWRAALTDRRNHAAPSIWLYGSIARGDQRAESDVDLIVALPTWASVPHGLEGLNSYSVDPGSLLPPAPFESIVQEMVVEINVGADRVLDVQVLAWDKLVDLSPGLRHALLQDGITIYPGVAEYIEAWPSRELGL